MATTGTATATAAATALPGTALFLLFVLRLPLLILAASTTSNLPPHSPYNLSLLHGGSYSGPINPASPDPLIRYRWSSTFNDTKHFQVFTRPPTRVTSATPAASFIDVASLLGPAASRNVTVGGNGDLAVDFGAECAGWIEFESPDLHLRLADAAPPTLLMSLSEYDAPGFYNTGPKTSAAVHVREHTYSLRLNSYEGVQYGFLHVRNFTSKATFHVTAFRQICQILPVNYQGGFSTNNGLSPSLLDRVWWSGAYTVKVNVEAQFFNSVLVDRGDRISWTGDAHLTQKLALYVFGLDDLVRQNIERTSGPGGYNGIPTYALYWVLSVVDYFWCTGDSSVLIVHHDELKRKLRAALAFWDAPFPLVFVGSDDRLGADFEGGGAPGEMSRMYRLLSLQATRAWVSRGVMACAACGSAMKEEAAALLQQADALAKRFRGGGGGVWTSGLYLHSAAAAVAANLTTAEEERTLHDRFFRNPARWCSFSPFNSYFLLDAVGRMRVDAMTTGPSSSSSSSSSSYCTALSMVRSCFGGMVGLGATTLWETYSTEWNQLFRPGEPTPNGQTGYMSRAHPWASGATPWLTRHVLGLRPTSPGWSTFDVVPMFGRGYVMGRPLVGCGGLGRRPIRGDQEENDEDDTMLPLTAVSGFVPTPLGNLSASFTLSSSSGSSGLFTVVTAEVVVPLSAKTTIVGRLGMPKLGGLVPQLLRVNGVVAPNATLSSDKHYVYVTLRGESGAKQTREKRFVVELTLVAEDVVVVEKEENNNGNNVNNTATLSLAPLPWVYSAHFVGADLLTLGNWLGKYGHVGYCLFHFDDVGTNLTHMSNVSDSNVSPGLVQPAAEVTLFYEANPVHWAPTVTAKGAEDDDDERALVDPRGVIHSAAPPPRKLGAWGTENPTACHQSVVIDVKLASNGTGRRTVSLYLVDWFRRGAQFAVEARELPSLELAVPTQKVTNVSSTGDGVYMTYEVTTSVRFRIMEITGDYPRSDADVFVSAVFID